MSTQFSDGQTVTIDRVHFETILRRANLNTEDGTSPIISISQTEYAGLKAIASKYANLRQNLVRGGVGEETIDLLSNDDATLEQQAGHASTPAPAPATATEYTPTFDSTSPMARPYASRSGPYNNSSHNNHSSGYHSQPKTYNQHVHTREVSDWVDGDADEDDSASACGGGHVGNNGNHGLNEAAVPARGQDRPFYERQCARSILLSNLAEGTTHADITEAIRGGQLLDIHLRPHDRTTAVSFLMAADARAFFDHVRRHDLYIRHKRVDIRWNDRQFILPGHVASKIGTGATRNLVIRRCDPRLTEAAVRDDLEHIHNLIVIKVDFIGGSCHIKTNSVHNAVFARTCMMSRLKYKHQKIEWDADECAQPIEQPATIKPPKETVPFKRRSANMGNRFQLLNIDGDEEDDVKPSSTFNSENNVGIAA